MFQREINSNFDIVFQKDMALTQERAEHRSNAIRKGSIFYDFHISLQKGDSYSGYSEISFELTSIPNELVLDFKGQEVRKVIQNGNTLQVTLEEGFLLLEKEKLKIGVNQVGVHYLNKYDNDGSGCVSFVDTDDKQYVSTQFAPYYANRVFPCFDQPDLKARMRLSVICPGDWKKVISNEYPLVDEPFVSQSYKKSTKSSFPEELDSYLTGKSGKMSIFPETKIMSTYLFCFVGGEYLELKLEEQKLYKNIPMSLYCIESLYPYMKNHAPFIFEIVIESMKFYEGFFNYPFAFNKYDQIFAHQYKWGAMENSGAVIVNDHFLFKEKVSTQTLLNWALTTSHELSHHWFGNLVTMKWWDDLWLNETFATFISYLCMQKLKGKLKTIDYESSMASFFQTKGRGYAEDSLVTTHPIRGKVENTSVADSIFDGITYQKGAATMKQFFYLMGEENFSKGLSDYFHKFQWSNATIDDFLGHMQVYFKIAEFSLNQWKELWLQKASLNVLSAEWNPKDLRKDAKMILRQTVNSSRFDTLRMHKIKIGFFKQNCQIDSLQVLILPQPETVITYDGSKEYKAVLLNFQDHDFVKITIDQESLGFLGQKVTQIEDLLSRQMIWNSFYEMVYDSKITTHKYVDIVIGSTSKEPSDSILGKNLQNVHMSISKFTPQKFRSSLNSKMLNFLYNFLAGISVEQSNRITILKNSLVKFAYTEEQIMMLVRWKDNADEKLKEKPMTVGQKWSTVSKIFALSSFTKEEKAALFQTQKQSDPSDTAKNYGHTCDALSSTPEQFELIYESFKAKDSKLSVESKKYLAAGWNSGYHKERLALYRDRYFNDIPKLAEILRGDHYQAFYTLLEPVDDDLESQITAFQKIELPADKMKHTKDILKIVDRLKMRLKIYGLYSDM